MTSPQPGGRTSAAEATNVSRWGLRLLLAERELFVSFEPFPWFRDVSIGQLVDVRLARAGHLRWPQFDVDLAVESIKHPERYPLVSKAAPRVAERRIRRLRR